MHAHVCNVSMCVRAGMQMFSLSLFLNLSFSHALTHMHQTHARTHTHAHAHTPQGNAEEERVQELSERVQILTDNIEVMRAQLNHNQPSCSDLEGRKLQKQESGGWDTGRDSQVAGDLVDSVILQVQRELLAAGLSERAEGHWSDNGVVGDVHEEGGGEEVLKIVRGISQAFTHEHM